MTWQVLTGIAGGIGLFLLGMELMTEGLKRSAGKSLQNILKHSTRTPIRGVLSGALITSLVQSSSAVTVATIGFVNAGLLKLKHAIRIAYGSNLGTTMTSWLVALVGFHVDLKAYALPAIGVGMLMTLLLKQERYASIGKVIAGFGLFFLGIDLMKGGFEGMQGTISLQAFETGGWLSMLAFVAVGFVMTLMMQSSSASIAMTLTAAAGGVISLPSAAAMVIGANVGTTSTAAIAAIGATPNARRVAAGHVIFNLVTGGVALLIMPLLLMSIQWFQSSSGMEGGVATFLALFHTVFNLLGVLLLWPFTRRLVRYLKTLFVAAEEDEAQPKYLDNTVVGTPQLAHEALIKELERIQSIAIRMAEDAINTEASMSPRLQVDLIVLHKLADAVGKFCVKLRRQDLPEEIAEALPQALAAVRYFIEVAEMAEEIDQLQSKEVLGVHEELELALAEMRARAVAIMEEVRLSSVEVSILEREADALKELEAHYDAVKNQLLRSGATGKLTARHMVALIEVMKNIERQVNHCVKGQSALLMFASRISDQLEESDDDEVEIAEAEASLDELKKMAPEDESVFEEAAASPGGAEPSARE